MSHVTLDQQNRTFSITAATARGKWAAILFLATAQSQWAGGAVLRFRLPSSTQCSTCPRCEHIHAGGFRFHWHHITYELQKEKNKTNKTKQNKQQPKAWVHQQLPFNHSIIKHNLVSHNTLVNRLLSKWREIFNCGGFFPTLKLIFHLLESYWPPFQLYTLSEKIGLIQEDLCFSTFQEPRY